MKLLSFIRDINNKKILVKFFMIFFTLVIASVIITSNITYYYSSKVIENEVNSYNDGILENIIDYNDNILWNLSHSSVRIINDENIVKILNTDSKSVDKASLIKIRELLKILKPHTA